MQCLEVLDMMYMWKFYLFFWSREKKKKGMKWTMQVSKSYIFDQDVREGQEKKNSFYILGKTKENIPEFL